MSNSTAIGFAATGLPYLPPPTSACPAYPPRPAIDGVPAGWTRSTHVAPCAFPRLIRESSGTLDRSSAPYASVVSGAKAERGRMAVEAATAAIRARRTATPTLADEQDGETMWFAVERWRRDRPAGGVTLVLGHACGMCKETYHPLLRRLLARLDSAQGAMPAVDDIYLLDDARQGCSADLNAGRLGLVSSVRDGARDVINFVRHVMPAADEVAPPALAWHARTHAPPVVAVAHSFSCNVIVYAAAEDPGAFRALLFVEPTFSPRAEDAKTSAKYCAAATLRRSAWPSREDASRHLFSTYPYNVWHPSVAAVFTQHGLVPVSDPSLAVQLATPPFAEVAVYADGTVELGAGWDAAGTLRVPVGLVWAGERPFLAESVRRGVEGRIRAVFTDTVQGGDHLLVQSSPDGMADALARFLSIIAAPRPAKL
ncbi:hypothetical protein Q5752_004733 [Cryptotrichosporon argae]